MHQPLTSVSYKHSFKKNQGGVIQRVAFSNRGNLFILASTDTQYIYMKLNVKHDLLESKMKAEKYETILATQSDQESDGEDSNE